jgi:YD repeat-containing protein
MGVDYSDTTPDVAYTFDRLGNQLSAISTVSTNLFVYSPQTLGLVSETQNGALITRSVDAFGRPSGLSFGDDYEVLYGYDSLGRFSAVQNVISTNELTQSRTNAFVYTRLSGSDLLTGYTLSSPVTNFQFQVSKSYEPHRDLITSVSNHVNHVNPVLISAYDYANDALGRRVSRQDSGLAFAQSQPNTFGYNPRSEVTSAVMYTNAYGYVYDPIGNRLLSSSNSETNTYVANSLNQYSNITLQAYSSQPDSLFPSYDADGNMTATDDGWHYTWNGENRLILASNDTHVVAYAYDFQGRMVSKAIDGAFRSYLWDDYNIIREDVAHQSSTINPEPFSVTNYNTWGLDLSGSLHGAGGVGGLLSVTTTSPDQPNCLATYYPSCDANGNITEYVAQDGTIAAHREYSAFGETTVLAGALADSFTHGWSTRPWCNVTGLNEYLYRKYYPKYGRWPSRDPINELGGPKEVHGDRVRVSEMYLDPSIRGFLGIWEEVDYVFSGNAPIHKYDYLGLAADCACPAGSKKGKKQNPDNFKKTDGKCTSPFGDNPVGHSSTSFLSVCLTHDKCYASCNETKGGCDDAFRQGLQNLCDSVAATYGKGSGVAKSCYLWAGIYLAGVQNFGDSWIAGSQSWSKLQKDACLECCCD